MIVEAKGLLLGEVFIAGDIGENKGKGEVYGFYHNVRVMAGGYIYMMGKIFCCRYQCGLHLYVVDLGHGSVQTQDVPLVTIQVN